MRITKYLRALLAVTLLALSLTACVPGATSPFAEKQDNTVTAKITKITSDQYFAGWHAEAKSVKGTSFKDVTIMINDVSKKKVTIKKGDCVEITSVGKNWQNFDVSWKLKQIKAVSDKQCSP